MLSAEERQAKIQQCPIMASLLESKALSLDGFCLIGIASDGIGVEIGSVYSNHDIDLAEKYLASHSSPSDW